MRPHFFQCSIARGSAAVGAALLGAIFLVSAPAQARELVDPHTLNPAPPDSFNATCYREGSHITCDLAFSEPNVVNDPSGVVCNGTELLISQSRSVVGKRFYDADGNLLERHFREFLGGQLTNPTTGKTALWTQHDTVIHTLQVPGDPSTGSTKVSGLQVRIWLPSGGTVLTDAGRTVIDPATDEVVSASAHHPVDDYFRLGDSAALAPLCDALS